jgi:hypothetical protein
VFGNEKLAPILDCEKVIQIGAPSITNPDRSIVKTDCRDDVINRACVNKKSANRIFIAYVHQFALDLAVELPNHLVESIAAATAQAHFCAGVGRHLRHGQTYACRATHNRYVLSGYHIVMSVEVCGALPLET